MTRSLKRAVIAGGVVYPVGTASTPELEQAITNPDHWSGEPDAAEDEPKPAQKRTAKKAASKED